MAHVVQLTLAARSGLLVPACPLPESSELTPALPVVVGVLHVQPAHCGHASVDACRHCVSLGEWDCRDGGGEVWRAATLALVPLNATVRASNVDYLQLRKGTIRTGC
jgi:hypothetical protein